MLPSSDALNTTPEAMVHFDRQVVEVDGGELPIVKMLNKRGQITYDPDQTCFVMAGEGDKWVSLRMLR